MSVASDRPALRLRRPQRQQVTPVPLYLDALLPDDHLARLIWAAVERLDLTAFTAEIKVVEGSPGRAAADPAVLVALWVYATRQRAAAERVARVEAALAALPAVQAAKPAGKKEEARVSTTDPEARVMTRAAGGYRPAYNIQLAAASGHQAIVGVDVSHLRCCHLR